MSNTVAYIEINVVALVILFLLYISIHNRKMNTLIGQKLFVLLICSNAVMLVLDSLQWALEGVQGPGIRELYTVISTFYFICNPVPCFVWSLYANYMVYKSEENLQKLLLPLTVPLIVNTILSIISAFNGCMFYIDGNHYYHRGKLFFVLAAICYSYLFYSLIFIIKKQKLIEEKFFIPILVFVVPPVIGGCIQVLYYGVSLVWVCMTISILVIYLNNQNNQLYVDYLTGLYNRRHLDYYLQERIKASSHKQKLAAMMIDLNSFKDINDLWGHAAGDEALVEAGKIIKNSLDENDLVCRYGGDEFVAVLELTDQSELPEFSNKIKENVQRFNEQKRVPYTIGLSIGFDTYDFSQKLSLQEFLHHVDSLMYEDKKVMKQIVI